MDSTYAPQSPDLSSFLSSPSKSQQHYHQQQNPSTAYAPRSPVIPSFNNPAIEAPTSQHNLHPTYNKQHHPFGGGYGAEPQQPAVDFEFEGYGGAQYMPPIPALPPQHSFENQHQQPSNPLYFDPLPQEQQYVPGYPTPDSYTPLEQSFPSQPSQPSETPRKPAMTSRQPRGSKGSHGSSSAQANPMQQYKDPNPNNIDIRTKFPVARIKRIMQADEEVGKVAQVTPVAVSKALELFMIALVSGAAEKAKEKGGKRVTAQHLKQVVLGSPEQFDFLAEIVGRVAEVTDGAGGEGRKRKDKGVKGEEASDSSEEEQKKVKKGKGRRKKSDD